MLGALWFARFSRSGFVDRQQIFVLQTRAAYHGLEDEHNYEWSQQRYESTRDQFIFAESRLFLIYLHQFKRLTIVAYDYYKQSCLWFLVFFL